MTSRASAADVADVDHRARAEVDVGDGEQRQPLQAPARRPRNSTRRTSLAGVAQQLVGRAVLLEHAADVEDGDAVGELDGLVDVVGDEHDRLAHPPLEVEQLVLQPGPHDRVDGAERLVHQQHRRVGGERPGHADPLLLAARELGRVAVEQLGVEADQLDQLVDPLPRSASLSQPSSWGTVAMFSAMVRWGNRPTCWMT